MNYTVLEQLVEERREKIIGWRRQIHRRPELGLDCIETAALVTGELEGLGYTVTTGLGRTGLLAELAGRSEGPVVGVRVDMDALPLEEETGLPFSSENAGRMHACGHDGHTAIGLGAASIMAGLKDQWSGWIKFFFQPGEENGNGAMRMIEDGALADRPPEALLGLHIHPSLPTGVVGPCYGVVTAGALEFRITLTGKGGHAAKPHQVRDPICAAGHLIVALQTIASRRIDPLQPLVVSLGEINAGAACNVIPEKVVLRGTVRFLTSAVRTAAVEGIKDILSGIESGFGVRAELEVSEEVPPLEVDDNLTAFVEQVLREYLSPELVKPETTPSMGAEDFAFFSQQVPSASFRLGCGDETRGNGPGLHNPCFDFDEEILIFGSKAVAYLLLRLLGRGS